MIKQNIGQRIINYWKYSCLSLSLITKTFSMFKAQFYTIFILCSGSIRLFIDCSPHGLIKLPCTIQNLPFLTPVEIMNLIKLSLFIVWNFYCVCWSIVAIIFTGTNDIMNTHVFEGDVLTNICTNLTNLLNYINIMFHSWQPHTCR